MENFIVSARKYRPQRFEDVVGQQSIANTLKLAILNHKLASAYLFCGPRGVGKTTCARIFAKTINCQDLQPDGEACNHCESCRSFLEQRSVNILELNAAANNSVEDIRAIIDQVRIPPQLGNYRVIILDEVHMLSQAAGNALLKTLEEPPSYVIFILATTEKQKIMPTILSRCQIFDFNRMEIADIVGNLKSVAEKENIKYEDAALNVIAEKADGGMRDALSIFDQVSNFSQGNITYHSVLSCINALDTDYYFRMTDLLVQHNVVDAMVLFNEVVNKGFNGGVFIGSLASHLRNVMMAKDPATIPLLNTGDDLKQRYQEQAARCPLKFLYYAIRICDRCSNDYRTSYNKRLSVELTLIEAAQYGEDDDGSSGLGPAKTLKPLFKQTQPPIKTNVNPAPAAQNNIAANTKTTVPAAPANPAPRVLNVGGGGVLKQALAAAKAQAAQSEGPAVSGSVQVSAPARAGLGHPKTFGRATNGGPEMERSEILGCLRPAPTISGAPFAPVPTTVAPATSTAPTTPVANSAASSSNNIVQTLMARLSSGELLMNSPVGAPDVSDGNRGDDSLNSAELPDPNNDDTASVNDGEENAADAAPLFTEAELRRGWDDIVLNIRPLDPPMAGRMAAMPVHAEGGDVVHVELHTELALPAFRPYIPFVEAFLRRRFRNPNLTVKTSILPPELQRVITDPNQLLQHMRAQNPDFAAAVDQLGLKIR